MDENITHISMHFMEDDHSYQAKIVIDGVATSHYVEKSQVPDQREFAMIALANSLDFEASELLNLECLKLPSGSLELNLDYIEETFNGINQK